MNKKEPLNLESYNIDAELFSDMLALWQYLHKTNQQLYSLVTQEQMQPIIDAWGKTFKIPD